MFMALFLASALQNPGATASSNAQANTVAAVTASTPLREVVYKVSFTRKLNVSNETYGGSISNNENVSTAAPPFAEAAGDATDSGTVTIDVMQVADNALGVRVTEQWTGSTTSATYLGNVASDGSVNFSGGQLNECTHAILEYFGSDVMAGEAANVGAAWTRTAQGQDASVTTNYSVGEIDGAIAKIHEQSTQKSKSIALMDTVVTEDIQYKPATLVPVSGMIVMHASRSSASSVTNVTEVGHFDRISDSRDKGTN